MFKLQTDWTKCPNFEADASVGILWTVNQGKAIRYHWNRNTKQLFRAVDDDCQPLGLCIDLDQALSVSLVHFGGTDGQNPAV